MRGYLEASYTQICEEPKKHLIPLKKTPFRFPINLRFREDLEASQNHRKRWILGRFFVPKLVSKSKFQNLTVYGTV